VGVVASAKRPISLNSPREALIDSLEQDTKAESAWILITHARLEDELRAQKAWRLFGRAVIAPVDRVSAQDPQSAERQGLISQLEQEMSAQSAWTLLCHDTIASRLGLNTTDHKCLDLIVRGAKIREPVTPGQLAKETFLTTGAVTGVLDRLEQAGFVQRLHDPEDRRRVILRPDMEKIHADVMPKFDELSCRFQELCNHYTDDELRLLIGFAQEAQVLLRDATAALRQVAPAAAISV
jgi:DNA-binding MarR family transcriptional regulator